MQFTLGIGIIVALTLPYERALADPPDGPIELLMINNEFEYGGTDRVVKFHFDEDSHDLIWTWENDAMDGYALKPDEGMYVEGGFGAIQWGRTGSFGNGHIPVNCDSTNIFEKAFIYADDIPSGSGTVHSDIEGIKLHHGDIIHLGSRRVQTDILQTAATGSGLSPGQPGSLTGKQICRIVTTLALGFTCAQVYMTGLNGVHELYNADHHLMATAILFSMNTLGLIGLYHGFLYIRGIMRSTQIQYNRVEMGRISDERPANQDGTEDAALENPRCL